MAGADGMKPLHGAVFDGNLEMSELLLKAGAEINSQEEQRGRTPLMLAASRSFVRIVHMLLEREADLYIVDHDEKTALDWARATNSFESFEVIEKALQAAQAGTED
jgi:ankyrin repeat protein